jgi:hypothetical protein
MKLFKSQIENLRATCLSLDRHIDSIELQLGFSTETTM